jgi:glycolate oxidase iron-sulfur subunit
MNYVKLINCMRCGVCLSTCPTYTETFLETASPRGRVALMRKVQDGDLEQTERLLSFLALCLDCQACATACPSGVNAGSLVAEFFCEKKEATGLGIMEELILRRLLPHPDLLENTIVPLRLYQRTGLQKLVRRMGLLKLFPAGLERMEGLLPQLPKRPLRQTIETVTPAQGQQRGTIGFFLGCVMSLVFSEASFATIQLLSALGYRVITPRDQVCCGAPNMLAGDLEGLRQDASHNVGIFGQHQLDYIVTDCGGCGAELKQYGHHLGESDEAAAFSSKVRDISQLLALHKDELRPLLKPLPIRATYHDSCHIAHCQGIRREPRELLQLIPGLDFCELEHADACCGSGGDYNLKQPQMADRILQRKLDSIAATGAELVVTSNPGCLLQLKKGLDDQMPQVRLTHLTELLYQNMTA